MPRTRAGQRAGLPAAPADAARTTYVTPLGEAAEAALAAHWLRLAGREPVGPTTLEINDRSIPARAEAEGIVWFDFAALCEGPRSAADYIEIARDFHTVLVAERAAARRRERRRRALRFVKLVDEFYDRHVNLLLSAAAEPFSLYRGRRHEREFERTSSRLVEMRSAQYLAREHRP